MFITIIFAILLIFVAISLIAVLIDGIRFAIQYIRKEEKNSAICRVRRDMVFLFVIGVLCVGFVGITQLTAFTPKIQGDNAIADLRQVTLNGRKEWISIRGRDKNNPILLFLAGGPGSSQMAANPDIHNSGYNTFRDLFSSEYGILDKVNYLRGIISTFNAVYPQLYDIDLRVDYHTLRVPVYFFLGRHDINAPVSFVEGYFDILDAPEKEIVWFEHSGHSPWINESTLFIEEILRVTGQ